MDEHHPETGSNIEWMLSSGQVSSHELADALLAEFYIPVYRLSLYLLEDASSASQAAQATFVSALLNTYRYRSPPGLRAWLFDLALETCLKQPRKARKPPLGFGIMDYVFLNKCLGLTVPEIARLLRIKNSQVETGLAMDIMRLTATLPASTSQEDNSDQVSRLSQALAARWPAPEIAEADRIELAATIAAQAHTADSRRRRLASLKEILLIGVIILGVTFGVNWGINGREPEVQPTPLSTPDARYLSSPARTHIIYFVQEGDTLASIAVMLGTSVNRLVAINSISTAAPLYAGESLWIEIPTSQPPKPSLVTPVSPLSLRSSSQAIQERLLQSAHLWHTLWADIQYYPNGPDSTAALHNLYRDQIWVSQPSQSLEVFGLPDNQIFLRRIATGGHGFTLPATTGEAYLDPDWSPSSQGLLRNPLVLALIFPGQSDWIRPLWTFRPTMSDTIAGRNSLVVLWTNPQGLPEARLWIDTLSGVILRRQTFATNAPDVILSDMAVSKIAYDIDIPGRLFDPANTLQDAFAQDFTGN